MWSHLTVGECEKVTMMRADRVSHMLADRPGASRSEISPEID
jgi:hypothetical protein